jgi:hypothetical protein
MGTPGSLLYNGLFAQGFFMKSRNELDSLLEEIEAEAKTRNLRIFRAAPIWDDEHLTMVEWRSDDEEQGWRQLLDLAAQQPHSPLLLTVAHAFHESAFEPSPLGLRARLDDDLRAQLEEREQLLVAAREFAGQTGRIEIGWIDNRVFYQWHRETDWYSRVWDLVMSGPFDLDDNDTD